MLADPSRNLRRVRVAAAVIAGLGSLVATMPGAGAATPPTSTSFPGVPVYSNIARTGPYRTVADGEQQVGSRTVSWRLQRAPGERSTTCWRFVGEPKARTPKYNGRDGSLCIPPSAADPDPTERVQFLAQSAKRSPYGLVAFSIPARSTDVRVGFEGGSTARLKAGRAPIVIIGKRTPMWIGLRLPDGTRLDCGAGAVTTRQDLEDPNLTGAATGAAWSCLDL